MSKSSIVLNSIKKLTCRERLSLYFRTKSRSRRGKRQIKQKRLSSLLSASFRLHYVCDIPLLTAQEMHTCAFRKTIRMRKVFAASAQGGATGAETTAAHTFPGENEEAEASGVLVFG